MMMSAWGLAALMALMVVLLVRYQRRAPAIFGVAMLVSVALGWVNTDTVLLNAANPGLATLVILMLIAIALEKTGFLQRLATRLFSPSETASAWKLMGVAALSSSVLNNTAVVAALIQAVRKNRFVLPSRLLIPLSYAAIMGGTLTLIGTSTNLIVNSMFTDTGHAGFGFFDFTLVGLGVLAGGLVVLYLVSLLLPRIEEGQSEASHYFVETRLQSDSPLVGQSVEQAGLRHLDELFLAEIVRDGHLISPVARYDLLEAGDKLLFTGDVTKVKRLEQFPGLKLFADDQGLATHQLTEVVVKEDSVLAGRTLKSTGFRARFDAAVVAIRREGEAVSGKLGEVTLQAGDFLLLATGPDFSARTNLTKNFYVLSGLRPDNMLSGWREQLTLWGFLGTIGVTVALGATLLTGVLFFLAVLLLTGCLNVNEIKRRFPVEIWLIVTSALTLAAALENTGLAAYITSFAQASLSGQAPYVTFIGVFLLTYLLTEVITNNAAAALMFPVAYSLALGLGIDPFPMILGVAFAASASFITPYGYQTNLMVFNASQYRLRDFVRSGVPVALTYITLSVLLIPLVFPFNP